MKRKLYLLLALIVGSCMFYACDSDDPSNNVGGTTTPKGVSLKVMTYNIYSGQKAYSGTKGLDTIAAVIKKVNPDIIGIQEFETGSDKLGKADAISLLRERTGMRYAYFAKTGYNPGGGDYGNLILSKYEISEGACYDLPRINEIGDDKYPRSIGIVKVKKNEKEFHFAVTHLSLIEESRVKQVSPILEKIANINGPVILTGDFNAYADSEPLNILREKFEIACLNDNYGLTVEPPVPTKAIDFILYTPDKGLLPVAYDVYYDAYYQSDHFPVVASFVIHD